MKTVLYCFFVYKLFGISRYSAPSFFPSNRKANDERISLYSFIPMSPADYHHWLVLARLYSLHHAIESMAMRYFSSISRLSFRCVFSFTEYAHHFRYAGLAHAKYRALHAGTRQMADAWSNMIIDYFAMILIGRWVMVLAFPIFIRYVLW